MCKYELYWLKSSDAERLNRTKTNHISLAMWQLMAGATVATFKLCKCKKQTYSGLEDDTAMI